MKQLIVCEKGSLAKNVANAIGITKATDGYYENDKYIVASAKGHLLSLYTIEDYEGEEAHNWINFFDKLPYIPKEFKYKVADTENGKISKEAKKINTAKVKLIKSLAERKDVSSFVNCGDADREGEIIIRNIFNYYVKVNKPMFRLWLSDQTPETIRHELNNMKSDDEYDALAREGYARTYVDWLYGINLSRYVSVKCGSTISVGRVIVPIVKAIYDRDKEIAEFQSKKYYMVEHGGVQGDIEYKLSCKEKFDDINQAKELAKNNNAGALIVNDIKIKEGKRKRPKLYSLSNLQGELGTKYKMSAKSVLDCVEELYMAGYVTYPRTDTQYLSEEEKSFANDVINSINKKGINGLAFRDTKDIFDSTKVQAHSALTPTTHIPDFINNIQNNDKLDNKQKVYKTIFDRFCAVFCEKDCIIEKTQVLFNTVTGETLKLNGEITKEKGFLVFDGKNNETEIPVFTVGQKIEPNFKVVEKNTEPPKHYTNKTLMDYLKNPFKKSSATTNDDEEVDYDALFAGVEIGTEATRASEIEKCKKLNYISEKNNSFKIEPLGAGLIDTLDKLQINLYQEKSVWLNQILKKTYNGEVSIEQIVKIAHKELKTIINNNVTVDKLNVTKETEIIGKCPKCGSNVVYKKGKTKEGKAYSFYGCSNYPTCKFSLEENHPFFACFKKKVTKKGSKTYTLAPLTITKPMAKALIGSGYVIVGGLFSEKTNKEYSLKFIVDWENNSRQFTTELVDMSEKYGKPYGSYKNKK